MRKATTAIVIGAALAAAMLSTGAASATPRHHPSGGDLVVLHSNGVLSRHDSGFPLLPRGKTRITGVARGDKLIGIDVRPATGVLYSLSAKGQLYTVDQDSGRATAVGTPVALNGSAIGFDFNPTVDRIRVVTDTGQNFRLVPDTGALAATDGPLAYAMTDPAAGTTPKVGAAGYTNSVAGATSTLLYDIDAARDTLVTQGSAPGVTPVVSPNTGQLFTVGKLGLRVTAVNGFDIRGAAPAGPFNPRDYEALAAVQFDGPRSLSVLAKVNLATGKAHVVAPLFGTAVGIAFVG
ncbi:DUF4394 domain-containing protein [Actinokineospora xionganensis]|uniref:DUF4394 domain-containing protein n=1 Tax=Actinokineospora xionganensis TaxID=2684470 RepID=A0ABR7L4L2_9PSEU|nr:DUF4394 domain-containing protein [Actinokineospora xionganensis]MBC6447626.1 DUF4394 domain-containing protein [Actinokineospora xionganensis]